MTHEPDAFAILATRAAELSLGLHSLDLLAQDAARGFPLPADAAALAVMLAHVHGPALGPEAAITVRLYRLERALHHAASPFTC